MKIVMIGNNAGGMYNFRGNLIQELKNNNHEVVIIVPDDPADVKRQLVYRLGVEVIHTPIDRRGINPIKDIGLMIQYFNIIKHIKPDIVITYTIKPNLYGGLVCKLCRVPYVANITGLGSIYEKKNTLQKIVTIALRFAMSCAKVVFFENTSNRDFYVSRKIVELRRTHLLNGAGVDLSKFSYEEYPENEITHFLFMGRLMEEKGVNELLTASKRLFEENPKIHLDILGRSEEAYTDQLKRGQEEGWLTYFGVQQDVRPYIRTCHCFVLPSWHEGMANTNLECAASGRPVITSNIHGCLEAVEDGVSGYLCEKQNADSLYKAMKKFCNLPYEERKAMGLAGRKRMEAVFDKKKVVEETIEELMR